METWNEKLKNVRISMGLSQQAVAEKLRIGRACYAHYEQGVREPTLALLKAICDLLDISADYLIGRTDF